MVCGLAAPLSGHSELCFRQIYQEMFLSFDFKDVARRVSQLVATDAAKLQGVSRELSTYNHTVCSLISLLPAALAPPCVKGNPIQTQPVTQI